jgi:fimbrial chaperone protein
MASTRRAWLEIAQVLALLVAQPAAAGAFGIAPTRLELAAAHRIDVLTVHNQDTAPALVQVRAFAWSQRSGRDQYDETRELLVAPPVFELPARAEQIVRVALRRDPDVARELSYRVVLQEVPRPLPAGTSGLNVALRLTIPVFVAPARPAHSELVWQAHYLADSTVRIEAANQGGAHVQISNFDVQFAGSATPLAVSTAQYLLPGSQVSWIVAPPADVKAHAVLLLRGSSDQGAFTAQVAESAQ